MSKERRDITAQHFAGAVLDPTFYDQVFHGKYDPVPFCKLTRRAWDVDLKKGCLVFDPQNGQPKQYVASAEKSPDSWKNFCEAHLKGMNPIFRHFHEDYFKNKSALTTEFLQTWNEVGSTVDYNSLKSHFFEGNQNIDSSAENDLFVRDWLNAMDVRDGIEESWIKLDNGDRFYFLDEFIRTSLLDSYVTFVYLYEPWLYVDAGRKYDIEKYTKLWTLDYGFKTPNNFKSLLRDKLKKLTYTNVEGDTTSMRLPFGKPFGFSEKIVFSPEAGKIDYEAKLTMCTSTRVRNQFLKDLKLYSERMGDESDAIDAANIPNPEEDGLLKIYPMHFALKEFNDKNVPVRSETMFFYTDVAEWAKIRAELMTDADSWAINASGAEEAFKEEILNEGLGITEDKVDRGIELSAIFDQYRTGYKENRVWVTEPYSWPSNVFPIINPRTKKPVFVNKSTGNPINFLDYNAEYVEYKNTPKWPYHCIYGTSDGTTDYLLSKHAIIERKVKQTDPDGKDYVYLISHGPVENQEYLMHHRNYLFADSILGPILFEFWELQKTDNPDVVREVNYSRVNQDYNPDEVMEDVFAPLNSETIESPDTKGNQFQYTHQLYDGLFPYVLDNTKIGNPRLTSDFTDKDVNFLLNEINMLNSRMEAIEEFGKAEELPIEEQRENMRKKLRALQNVERTIARKCTSDYTQGPHYYYNVPLSAVGDNLKVRVRGETVIDWALGRYTSCAFEMHHIDSKKVEVLVDANNCAVTRSESHEEMHELFDVNNAGRYVAHDTKPRENTLHRSDRPFDFNFTNFKVRLVKSGQCTIPGMGEAAVDQVGDKIDLRMFPGTRVIGPPQMFQAPGMWGFVNSFLRFPEDTGASAMMIKDRKTNDSCVLLAFDNMKYIFVPNTDVRGDEFILRQIKPHEQKDYELLQLIRQSGGFRGDISRTPGGNRFFMRAFSTTQDRTDYEPIASEKLASDRYYASNDGQHRMAHTFYDGSASGSKSECIGCFVQVKHSTSVPGRDVTSSGMDGTSFSSAISKRLALIRTPGGDSATHGIDGLWQCWYCNQRRETVANIDVRDGENFSFGAMHNMS